MAGPRTLRAKRRHTSIHRGCQGFSYSLRSDASVFRGALGPPTEDYRMTTPQTVWTERDYVQGLELCAFRTRFGSVEYHIRDLRETDELGLHPIVAQVPSEALARTIVQDWTHLSAEERSRKAAW